MLKIKFHKNLSTWSWVQYMQTEGRTDSHI